MAVPSPMSAGVSRSIIRVSLADDGSALPGEWQSASACAAPSAPVQLPAPDLLFFQRLTDPENMPVGMAHMHLAHVPCLIRRRPGHVQTLFGAVPVFGVHVIHPDRYPHTLVRRLVASPAE